MSYNLHYNCPSLDECFNEEHTKDKLLLASLGEVIKSLLVDECDLRLEKGDDLISINVSISIGSKSDEPVNIV